MVDRVGMGLDLRLKGLPHCFIFSYWNGIRSCGVGEELESWRGGGGGGGADSLGDINQDSPTPPPFALLIRFINNPFTP